MDAGSRLDPLRARVLKSIRMSPYLTVFEVPILPILVVTASVLCLFLPPSRSTPYFCFLVFPRQVGTSWSLP